MHVDQGLARVGSFEQRVPASRHLAQAATDREHEVGVCETRGEAVVHRHAEDAGVARRGVVDEVLAAERAGDRQLVRLAEREHVLARRGRPAALADDDERALGRGEQLPQACQVLGARRHGCDLDRRRVLDVGLLGEHVLGQCEHDRPRPARERGLVRARDVLRDPLRALDLPRRLRDAGERLPVVDLLPGLAAAKRARHLADEQQHRRRVLARRVHADGGLRRSRATRHEADPGPPGELAVRLGGVRGALLVTARHEPDRRVVERVEHGEEALAGEAEREVGAVQLELVDDDPAAGPHSGTSSRTRARWSFGFSSSAGSRYRIVRLPAHSAGSSRTRTNAVVLGRRGRREHRRRPRPRTTTRRLGTCSRRRLGRSSARRAGACGCRDRDGRAGTRRRRAGSRRGRSGGPSRPGLDPPPPRRAARARRPRPRPHAPCRARRRRRHGCPGPATTPFSCSESARINGSTGRRR